MRQNRRIIQALLAVAIITVLPSSSRGGLGRHGDPERVQRRDPGLLRFARNDAHPPHGHHRTQSACEGPDLACASVATAAFADDGALWLVWAAGGYVSAAKSNDRGRTFGPRKAINTEPADIDWGPDARPKIIAAKQGRIAVTFTVFKDKAFNGRVFYSASQDGGETFTPPVPITANEESQRFEALALDSDGKLFLAWLDKRNRAAAKAKGEKYSGAALAFAWADGKSLSIGETRLAHDNTCECCRIAVAFAEPSKPVVVFRNIFEGGIRDHAVITFSGPLTPGPVKRVSVDNWKTEACPHQGPSIAVSASGTYHAAWYTAGQNRSGVFYASSSDAGEHFSSPLPLGDRDHAPSRPAVFASGQTVWLAWKEFDGERTRIFVSSSPDDGQNWSQAEEAAQTAGDSDQPLLIGGKHGVFLSWMTREEGYRLVSLGSGS